MAREPILPRQQKALVDAAARPVTAWMDFFRDLLGRVNEDAGLVAEIEAALARLEALENADIRGLNSVITFGSLSSGLVNIMLQGDALLPGDLLYYGTGPTGNKGFWPAASLVEYMVDEDGNFLVDNEGNYLISRDITADLFAIVDTSFGLLTHTGNGTWEARTLIEGAGIDITDGDGVAGNPTIAHADTSSVADLTSNNSNGVVIQDVTITFDTFGHVQTATVGTVDLDLRYLQATSVGNGLKIVSNVLSAGESGTETAATFLRGDGVWNNTLVGSLAVDNATSASPGLLAGIFGVYVAAPDATASFIHLDAFGNSAGLLFRASGGTAASKTALASAGLIGQFQGRGYNGSAYSSEAVGIQFAAAEAWTSSAQGTRILLRTTANGTTTATTRWRIEDTGTILPFANNTYDVGTNANRVANTVTQNVIVGPNAASLGGGSGVEFLSNATTVPTSNPTGGVIVYGESGAGKARGTSGTITTWAPADPHCPVCGTDFVHEWDNVEKYGYLAVCMNCFADGVHSHTRIRGAWSTH